MWKIIKKTLFVSLLLAGVAHAQPGPPSALTVGSTNIIGGSAGNCLIKNATTGRLDATACAVGSVIAPANGGTGTSTIFTPGSLPFAGSSGIYQQDNANLFYDVTNKRLGIGTAAPASMLHIVGKNNSADGIQVDSTTQARVMVNNTSGGASKLSSVVFAKNFNIFDNTASANRLQIDPSGNVLALSGTVSSVSGVVAYSGTSIPAGGTTGAGFKFTSATNFGIFGGSGAPTLSAAQGSIYLRSDGVPFYNNNGTTGWSSLATGSGTVNAGTINQMAWYAGTGSTVSGLATGNSGVLVTSGAGVPSIGTVLPNGITATTQATNDNTTAIATDAFVQAAATAASLISTPVGVCLPFGGAAAPSASWVLAAGQAISRTTFASAFAVFGVVYGSGDGSTTFNVPDLRGRVPVEADAAGGTPASRISTATLSAVTPGGSGGAQTATATTSSSGVNGINYGNVGGQTSGGWSGSAPAQAGADFFALTTSSLSNITTNPINGNFNISVSGTSSAFTNMQPTLVMNYICRVQ